MKTLLGFFDNNASGLLRNRLDGAASETVLVIAHRMRTVEAADKIVVLKDGMVAEQGKPEDLMNTGGEFAKMVNLQSESAKWAVAEAVTNKR